MAETVPAYGLWTLVIVNSAIIILFAFSFVRPKTKTDWRSLGTFSAFIVALFAEMYGFPLTIYLLAGWLQSRFPNTDIFSHDSGHIWYTLLGFKGDPHYNPIHLMSNLLIFGGFVVVAIAWSVLHKAQRENELATSGPYAVVRHPQYDGFIIVMAGFMLMWPTLVTLIMFPILVFVYVRLARREELEAFERFGERYARYAERTPGFIPSFRKMREPPSRFTANRVRGK